MNTVETKIENLLESWFIEEAVHSKRTHPNSSKLLNKDNAYERLNGKTVPKAGALAKATRRQRDFTADETRDVRRQGVKLPAVHV